MGDVTSRVARAFAVLEAFTPRRPSLALSEIARRASLLPITEVAAQMGIGSELLEPYGSHVAKVKLDAVSALEGRPRLLLQGLSS